MNCVCGNPESKHYRWPDNTLRCIPPTKENQWKIHLLNAEAYKDMNKKSVN